MAATPVEKAVKAARTRNKNAALRSLRLIKDAVDQHIGLLEQGAVPEGSFMASALKYDQCLTAMRTADTALGGAGGSMPDTVEISRQTVATAVQLLQTLPAFAAAASTAQEGSPVRELLEAAVADSQAPAGEAPAS